MLIDAVGNPAEDVWRDLSLAMYEAQGPGVYEASLIPGFPETQGMNVLWGGDAYDGEVEETEDERSNKKKAKKGKRVAGWLKKLSSESWKYEEGGRQQYWEDPNPQGREYSLRRERDNESGTQIAWDQVGENFYRDSKSPEPAFLNQDNYNTGTTHNYKQSAIEPDVTESQSYSHTPATDTQNRRTMDTLHEFVTEMDPMTDEVPGLNFIGQDLHYADQKYANQAPKRMWDYPYHAQYSDEVTEHARLPGRKPVVRDAYDELNANNVWDEHDAYTANKGIIDYAANPGPAV
jgi:hypothetical protein